MPCHKNVVVLSDFGARVTSRVRADGVALGSAETSDEAGIVEIEYSVA